MDGEVKESGVTTISSKNQITIPVAVLKAAGLTAGDRMQVVGKEDGTLRLVRDIDAVVEFAGALTGKIDRKWLDELDEEWD